MSLLTEKNRESIQSNITSSGLYESEKRVKEFIDSGQFKEEDKKGIDVPFIDLESILTATDDFSNANKLGQGGFGPVYKVETLCDYIQFSFSAENFNQTLNTFCGL